MCDFRNIFFKLEKLKMHKILVYNLKLLIEKEILNLGSLFQKYLAEVPSAVWGKNRSLNSKNFLFFLA